MTRRRRKEDNFLDGILDLFLDIGKVLPWWVILPAAILLFTLIPFEIPTNVQTQQPTDFIWILGGMFLKALFKYLVPIALVAGAAISFFKKTKNQLRGGVSTCPKCGADLVERKGSRGRFIGCSSYPKCRYTEDL